MSFAGAPEYVKAKAPPEVNRFWRRLMWDTELTRLYSHLDQVSHSVDTAQKKLYLENTFHDQARDRANELYADKIARENVGLFKRLMAVHTRKPREFLTHHVQNPKTHSRYLEYQRVMQDNHRLVDRLLRTKTFVNERGTWDEHALEHEEILLRLSQNPKNCFIPNLKKKRRRHLQMMREHSIARQALANMQRKPLGGYQASLPVELRRKSTRGEGSDGEEEEKQQSGFEDEIHSARRRHEEAQHMKYTYPLPPNTIVHGGAEYADPSSSHRHHHQHQPHILLPAGTHLVAPALVDQTQYESLSHSLAGVDIHARGDANHLRVLPMPPSAYDYQHFDSQQQQEQHNNITDEHYDAERANQEVFYLRPHGLKVQEESKESENEEHSNEHDPSNPDDNEQLSHDPSNTIAYPFRFPPLETRSGTLIGVERSDEENTDTEGENGEEGEQGEEGETDGEAEQQQQHPPLRRPHSNEQEYYHSSHQQHHLEMTQRASTAIPAPRSYNNEQQHHNPHPPSHPSHSHQSSQKFLDYFNTTSQTILGTPPVPQNVRTHRDGRRYPTKPPSAAPATKSSLLSAANHHHLLAHMHRFHEPSVFAHSTSASSSSGPRGSAQSRRTQERAIENLIDQILESGGGEAESPQQKPKQQRKPQPPKTAKKHEVEEEKTQTPLTLPSIN